MKYFMCSLAAVLMLMTSQIVEGGSGWLIFHEKSFRGKVIDAETKEPIEGAVVVVQYHINMLGPTGMHTTLADVQEALTDHKGEFFIPSKTMMINPLSVGDETSFLVWKPGYKRKDIWGGYFFAKEPGSVENRPAHTEKGLELKPMKLGLVELDKFKTCEERLHGMPSPVGDLDNKQPKLIRVINEERKHLGLEGELKIKEGK
ncbi:MAG: carboxypeptidase regulatory-like domain-containing protein [Deltaproteobacteria bacterium]|nr:carboxypeptidase regulatory-like domain-containing protein [Deltaproteobacteria bacterium]